MDGSAGFINTMHHIQKGYTCGFIKKGEEDIEVVTHDVKIGEKLSYDK